MESGSKDPSLSAIHHQIYRHLRKYGVFRRRVTRVAQNTRYDEGVKAGYVAFINAGLTAGKYKASDIVNIHETNVDFDLVSGSTLAGRGEKTIGCATTGSSSRCTVLLGVTMDGEKLPSYIIFKGANTPRSLIKKESNDVEARTKYGYHEGHFYTIQPKAWMEQYHMLDWVNCMWEQYTKGSRRDVRDTHLLMNEFSVHLVRSVCNSINKCGTEVEFIPGCYMVCLQILDKWVTTPFKGYLRDEFERWMMANGSRRKPMRAEVSRWI
jgi:hypothetical protein